MKLPQSLNQLIEDLKKLPGIGSKTAERLALFVVNDMDEQYVESLSKSLIEVKTMTEHCPICGMIKEGECSICNNSLRNQNQIMVVGTLKDLLVIENSGNYDGLYHILGGTIDFSKGVEPEDLFIDGLLKRIKDNIEVILALNGAIDGELTSSYLEEILKEKKVKISKLAYGIPIGGDLSYADKKTLQVALKNRTLIK